MRLDLDNPETFDKLVDIGIDVISRIKWDFPTDVCNNCYIIERFDDDVAHPPYEEDLPYKCAICGEILTEEDYGNVGT